uniref:Uncharacterized protein n=1 Tax=Chromera velia CCMP2878 TaxID=1169474 RepID=A0A0G4EYR0_9ALVE|eukprot:Cvel_14201.t1-p1 / transcript=Cvel_14201.t1 / gene=Cvel_14201 / organism=Chromera_velia_CCMP2878 / gene_product=hypothetical protein / transcript_product=hypothetical protein / location=Cvel_scaffold1001:15910-18005(-) / protein_length=241 / sequence_SO=supercontig / SO=protein_coding / is_pseudo=false
MDMAVGPQPMRTQRLTPPCHSDLKQALHGSSLRRGWQGGEGIRGADRMALCLSGCVCAREENWEKAKCLIVNLGELILMALLWAVAVGVCVYGAFLWLVLWLAFAAHQGENEAENGAASSPIPRRGAPVVVAPPSSFERIDPEAHVVVVRPGKGGHRDRVLNYVKFRLECEVRDLLLAVPSGSRGSYSVSVARLRREWGEKKNADVRRLGSNHLLQRPIVVRSFVRRFWDVFEVFDTGAPH